MSCEALRRDRSLRFPYGGLLGADLPGQDHDLALLDRVLHPGERLDMAPSSVDEAWIRRLGERLGGKAVVVEVLSFPSNFVFQG